MGDEVELMPKRSKRGSRTLSFLRFLADVRAFAGERPSPEQARRIVDRRLAEREATFLRTVSRQIFDNPASPYLPLLRRAGCEAGDLARLVRTEGLETALARLHDAGVYVSFEEFKGRRPIVRGDLVIDASPDDFDNPGVKGAVTSSSGGSSGRPVRFSFDLRHMRTFLPTNLLQFEALGLLGAPAVSWWEDLPSPTGIKAALRAVAFDQPLERWFSIPLPRRPLTAARGRLATLLIVGAGRASGARVPWPRRLPLERADLIARWVAGVLASSDRCVVMTNVSRAVRVSQAARTEGTSLAGATFYGASDPPSEAKAAEIRASGARHVPNYFISEAGCVGVGCARPASANDLHFCADMFAFHPVPEPSVLGTHRIYLTALAEATPKVLLNVDTDDCAYVEERRCTCRLDDAGLRTHFRDVFGKSKLTAEGVTLAGSDIVRILEEVLPARFGGSSLDYQLLEEEEGGLTRISLVVSPRVTIADEQEVIDTFLRSLGSTPLATDVRGLWRAARTMRIKRAEPQVTDRGKQLPVARGRRSPNTGP